MSFRYLSFTILSFFLVFASFSLTSIAHAQEQSACYVTTGGDYRCPQGGGEAGTNNPFLGYAGQSGSSILGDSSLIGSLGGASGLPTGLEAAIASVLDQLSPDLQNALLIRLAALIGTDPSEAEILALLAEFTGINSFLDGIKDMVCGPVNAASDFMAYARGSIAADMAIFGSSFDLPSAVTDFCGGGSAGQECSQSGPSLSPTGSDGARIADTARQMIGYSTSCVDGTNNGTLACAWVVSTILQEAGYPLPGGVTLGTVQLHEWLTADRCYKVVDTGNITPDDAVRLEEGDILVTPTNFDMTGGSGTCKSSYKDRPVGDPLRRCNSGHTGIYVGNGGVVSNGSENTEGPGAGVSENYTVDSWSKITNRNTAESAVFRRVPGCT